MYAAILGIVVFATLAMMVREGIWSNTIALLQILISGVVAFGYYQPLTVMLDERLDGEYTYALDIVVIWGLYGATMLLLKIGCEALSKTRLRFPGLADDIGGPVIGLVAGFLLAGFVGATLHVAPLPQDGLGGGMDYSEASISDAPIYAPDIAWLRVVEAATAAGFSGQKAFSAEDFVAIYGNRRAQQAETEGFLVKRKRG